MAQPIICCNDCCLVDCCECCHQGDCGECLFCCSCCQTNDQLAPWNRPKKTCFHVKCCCGLYQWDVCPCCPSVCDCATDCDNYRFNCCVCSFCCCICDPCACCMGPYKGNALNLENEVWAKHHAKHGAPQAQEMVR